MRLSINCDLGPLVLLRVFAGRHSLSGNIRQLIAMYAIDRDRVTVEVSVQHGLLIRPSSEYSIH